MRTFKSKPKLIKAEVFSWGMEDGVMRYNEIIPKDGNEYPEEIRSKKYPGYLDGYNLDLIDRGFEDGQWNPYIVTIHGQNTRIAKHDMIIEEPNGINHYPCKPHIFQLGYEEVKEEYIEMPNIDPRIDLFGGNNNK